MQGFDVIIAHFQNWPIRILWLFLAVAILLSLLILSFIIDGKRQERKKAKLENTTALPAPQVSSDPTSIYQLILELSGLKVFLFGGAGISCMPVTIPVKTASMLAEDGKKVLLIDLDTQRDSLARVFFEDSSEVQGKNTEMKSIWSTFIDDIYLWPANNFKKSRQMNIQQVIRDNKDDYDIILVYCPSLDASTDRAQIANACDSGVIFAKNQIQLDRIIELYSKNRCLIRGCFLTEETIEQVSA